MPIRRIKTYSAPTGYVYQYYFLESRPRRRLWGQSGTVFLFDVSSDRKNYVPIEIVVEGSAQEAWEKAHGRKLTDTEKYAAAKMGLFRAFDESASPEQLRHVRIDDSNIESLLEPLRLDD